ncbi:MAG: hypothetical protein FJ293_10595 [Planctomycetes bacterium]|nr:hypothetical protein [Planctomycetota bacterium]
MTAALAVPGCAAVDVAATGERVGQDLFVVATSPLQVPWVAARDAWEWTAAPERSRAWLPLAFLGGVVVHGGLAALHALDVVAAPIHLVAGNGKAQVYAGFDLPHVDAPAPLGPAAGELALWGAAGAGGAVIAWWFGASYVPNLFAVFGG